MPLRQIIRLIKAIAAADIARDARARTDFWFALTTAGVPAIWVERVYGEHVRRLEARAATLRARVQLREAA